MKKVMLLVLTVMLISAFLMASGPSLRIVRLTVINKSGNEVMIKLEGSDLGKQFYYLTIAAGTKTFPEVATFTVLEDIYKRTTWYGEGQYAQCVGTSSGGMLIMDKNVRLTFTPCWVVPTRTAKKVIDTEVSVIKVCDTASQYYDAFLCHAVEAETEEVCASHPAFCNTYGSKETISVRTINNGEPTQEKVVFYQTVKLFDGSSPPWDDWDPWGSDLNVYWKRGCGNNSYFWYLSSQRVPTRGLCQWRYLYDSTHQW